MALRLSAHMTVMQNAAQRAAEAPAARLQRGRAVAGQRQGPRRLRQPGRPARRADAARRPRQGPARLRLPDGGIAAPSARDNWTWRWVVDPLDGTTNFLHGIPHWAISHRRWNAACPTARSEIAAGAGLRARRSTRCSGPKRASAPSSTTAACASPPAATSRRRVFATGIPFAAVAAAQPPGLRPHARHADAAGRRHPPVRRGRARPRLDRGRAATTATGNSASSRGTSRPGC